MNVTMCGICGAPIVWIKTKNGTHKCSAVPIPYRAKPGGYVKIVTQAGDVVCCEPFADPKEATGWGYLLHGMTCAAYKKHRHVRRSSNEKN